MNQPSLFDTPSLPAIARKKDPVSSKIAAHAITDSGYRETQCKKVLLLVKDYPGRTSKELSELTWEFDRYVFARRLADLEKQGLVRKAGVKDKTKEVTWEAL